MRCDNVAVVRRGAVRRFGPNRSCNDSLSQSLVLSSRERGCAFGQREKGGLCYLRFWLCLQLLDPHQSRLCFVSAPAARLQDNLTDFNSVEVSETVVGIILVFNSPVGRWEGCESGTQQAATHGASSSGGE